MSRTGYNGFTDQDILRGSRIQSSALQSKALERVWVCEPCGLRGKKPGHIISHLEDYSDPIDGAIWLCYRCHTVLHLRDDYPEEWDSYREIVGSGGRYERCWGQSRVIQDMINTPLLLVPPARERRRTVLDDVADGLFLDMSERPEVKMRLEAMHSKGYAGLMALKVTEGQETLF